VSTAKLALLWKILQIFERSFVLGFFSVKFIATVISHGTIAVITSTFTL